MWLRRECIVYLDYMKKQGDGIYNVYIDFRLKKDLTLFVRSSEKNQNFGETNTYLELCNVRTNKRLRSGCYYRLNLALINELQFIQNEESLFIGRTYDCETMKLPHIDQEELLQSHELLDPTELLHNSNPNEFVVEDLSNVNLTLNVRDVNQANWNEVLKDGRIKLVYDLGAPLNASKDEVQAIFDTRRNILERDKPILIISHWDMDHIHCLQYVNLQTIKNCFSQVICVDAMKSITSQNIYNNICNALGIGSVYCIQPQRRTNGIFMHLWKRVGNISIYIGEKSSNINYCGLCIFVKGMQSSVNFTGDIRLIQAKHIYDQELQQNIGTNNHILLAPHHGGDNTPQYRIYSNPTTEVIISVGPNNYGHPNKHMLSYLRMLCNNNIYRTDVNGDVVINI